MKKPITLLYCLLLVFLVGIVSFWNIQLKSSKSIGTVDLTGIVQRFLKNETKSSSPALVKKHMKQFSNQLETALKEVGLRHQVVLLAKEAVIGGAKDYSDEILSLMAKKI